jgi:hypothetical protein
VADNQTTPRRHVTGAGWSDDPRTDAVPELLTVKEMDLIRRHRAAYAYDEDGTHFLSRVCQECGWEVPIQQRDLSACPGCGEHLP